MRDVRDVVDNGGVRRCYKQDVSSLGYQDGKDFALQIPYLNALFKDTDIALVLKKWKKRGVLFNHYAHQIQSYHPYCDRVLTIAHPSVRKIAFERYIKAEDVDVWFYIYLNPMLYIEWYESL